MKIALPLAAFAVLAACGGGAIGGEAAAPVPGSGGTLAAPQPERSGSAQFTFAGELTQGGWVRGVAPAGTVQAFLDDVPLTLGGNNAYFAAFDRDAGGQAVLRAELGGGAVKTTTLSIAPRQWNIEHVGVARRSGGPSATFMARRQPELDAIWAARQKVTGATGFAQPFIWPVKGRISGRFGSQRVYRGEPGSYHSGIDIAPGDRVPFVAPADGVVVLAAGNFSLEGNLLIIDHGAGLNSAFLHSSKLAVKDGDRVRQGQYIGNIGASGRATGPHLHWSLKWHNARLDPLLFTGPMN